MSFLSDVFCSDVACRLGWTLLHSLWQCAGVAVVLAVALQALRRRSANARYIVACVGVAMMLAGFVATLFLLPSQNEGQAGAFSDEGRGSAVINEGQANATANDGRAGAVTTAADGRTADEPTSASTPNPRSPDVSWPKWLQTETRLPD